MGVNYAEFSPMAKQLLQHHKIKRARLWDVKTGKQLVLFKGHENNIERVLYSVRMDKEFLLNPIEKCVYGISIQENRL